MQNYPEATFLTKFNQVEHEMEIFLDSSNGSNDAPRFKFPINPNAIVNMAIEDTLADWAVRGTLTFFFNPEIPENVLDPTFGQYTNASKPSYQFRGDGNDKLRIRIFPKLKSGDGSTAQGINISDPVHWTLSYLFSIYDMEDVDLPPGAQNQASATIKCLKIYFWDEWYQKMISNVIEYSTARSNIDQKLPSGIAMKEIIEKALEGVDSTDGVPVGSEAQGFWESGKSEVFFTAPSQYTSYECLQYVYGRHLSNVGYQTKSGGEVQDLSIMIKERGPNPENVGFLTLRPLSYFFERAGKDQPGEFQIEHFFLQGYGNSEKNQRPTKTLKAPINDGSNDKIDFKSLKYGMISNYRFVDIAPLTNTISFTNKPVYSFDFKNRIYHVEFQPNTPKAAREFIAEKYIKPLYKNEGADPEKLFLIQIDKEKEEFKNTRLNFSLLGGEEYVEERQADGIQDLIYSAIFQNACVNFRTLGLTNREPGRFIAIDRTEGVEDGDFQNKFFGQWFVINVKHVFESEFYYNDITAVKIHRFDVKRAQFPDTY